MMEYCALPVRALLICCDRSIVTTIGGTFDGPRGALIDRQKWPLLTTEKWLFTQYYSRCSIGSGDNHKDQRPKPTRQTGGGGFRLPLWDWETNWIMIFKRQDPEK